MDWWFSSERMTVWVREEYGIIKDTAPIARKFIGQPLGNLERWMARQDNFQKCPLDIGR